MSVDTGKPGGANAFALSDDHSLPAPASGLLATDRLADAKASDSDEGFCPFAPEIRLDWENAMASPFFQEHYGCRKDDPGNDTWRRVDSDWLAGAAALALRAGAYTNNISLVLAFDMPDSEKMLLFPGDAQVGNWLSWHTITSWKFHKEPVPIDAPAPNDNQTLMENLLSRVAFYKVSHHGSHNATIKDKGWEKMTREDLVAYIPVSVPVAHDLMGYCPMPFYPVMRALQVRTQGRVFLPNGLAVIPLPPGKTNESLLTEAGIIPSDDVDPALNLSALETYEPPRQTVPLYLEVTVTA